DPELAAAAKRGGANVRELREPPADVPIGGHRARREGARVVLTVGSDAAVGKMTASLEIVAALRRAGERVEFVATGQTGSAIASGVGRSGGTSSSTSARPHGAGRPAIRRREWWPWRSTRLA